MEKEHLKQCPSCGANRNSDFIESNGEQIKKCLDCGQLYVNPRPTEQAIKKLFVEEYIETESRVTEDFTNWRLGSLRRESQHLIKLLPNGGRLLDLGTASGAFLGMFVNLPEWHVEGVEPSRFAAKAAMDRYNVTVHSGFLRDLNLADESFDVVTSLDAFPLHPEPNADLEEIHRVLKPGGVLAIEIPGLRYRLLKNTGFLCRMIYGVPARLNAGVHLFYYSRDTLGKMAARHGFQEVATYPESSPVYGSPLFRFATWLYFVLVSLLYKVTGGAAWVPVPKEFLIYRKAA